MTAKANKAIKATPANKPGGASGSSNGLAESRSPMPLYHRLFVILRQRITDGTYPSDHQLPSEIELAQAFKVSRITVKRALNDLAEEGLVVRARGRGTTVTKANSTSQVVAPIAASIEGLFANLSVIGARTTAKLMTLEYVAANPHVARQLGLAEGVVLQHSVRVRSMQGRPFSHSQSFLLEEIGRTLSAGDLAKTPLVDLIARARVQIDRVQQSITCTLADSLAAERLDVDVGAPLLKLCRVFYDAHGRAINYSEVLYPPDRFEYRMSWTRGASNQLELDTQPQQ